MSLHEPTQMRRTTLAFLGSLVFGGCATGYHQHGLSGGYSETRLNERTFEVRFRGNGYTSPAVAQRGALHRAAELTAQMGYYGFYVVGRNTDVRTTSYTDPVNCSSYGNSTTCNGGDTTYIHKPDAGMTITMVPLEEVEQMPPSVVVYNAQMLLSQMAGE